MGRPHRSTGMIGSCAPQIAVPTRGRNGRAPEPRACLCVLTATGPRGPCDAQRSSLMHTDQIKGAAKDAKGSIKEGLAKATGNHRIAAEAAPDRAAGNVQNDASSI